MLLEYIETGYLSCFTSREMQRYIVGYLFQVSNWPKLTFLESSLKKSLASPQIFSSSSTIHVASSLICPLTLTMSFRMRWVSTCNVVFLTWVEGSRNLNADKMTHAFNQCSLWESWLVPRDRFFTQHSRIPVFHLYKALWREEIKLCLWKPQTIS